MLAVLGAGLEEDEVNVEAFSDGRRRRGEECIVRRQLVSRDVEHRGLLASSRSLEARRPGDGLDMSAAGRKGAVKQCL
jgi:hypothetical protein